MFLLVWLSLETNWKVTNLQLCAAQDICLKDVHDVKIKVLKTVAWNGLKNCQQNWWYNFRIFFLFVWCVLDVRFLNQGNALEMTFHSSSNSWVKVCGGLIFFFFALFWCLGFFCIFLICSCLHCILDSLLGGFVSLLFLPDSHRFHCWGLGSCSSLL